MIPEQATFSTAHFHPSLTVLPSRYFGQLLFAPFLVTSLPGYSKGRQIAETIPQALPCNFYISLVTAGLEFDKAFHSFPGLRSATGKGRRRWLSCRYCAEYDLTPFRHTTTRHSISPHYIRIKAASALNDATISCPSLSVWYLVFEALSFCTLTYSHRYFATQREKRGKVYQLPNCIWYWAVMIVKLPRNRISTTNAAFPD